MSSLLSIMNHIAQRQDLALVALLVMTVFMIILPLPTWLIDLLIGMNLSLVILILIVTIYLKNPTSFSTLPSILLFSTLFRLAISISTTRMILVQADAGAIVETFGNFVVAGSVVVGMVIFLIITIVQFIVVTKGSERVAEVSARFSLDALPGRQMSIDSDMRSGEIDMAEAKQRRTDLQLESEFYGAMDGAMKFVKGDAIAGLIIIAVNLIGGIAVGVLTHEMSGGDAVSRYSLLTVGDGLVSQIPALLMAISAGIVITRITHEESRDLGHDIANQVTASPRALWIAGGVLVVFSIVPGFPAVVFLTLAVFFIGCGVMVHIHQNAEPERDSGSLRSSSPSEARQDLIMTPMAPVHLALGKHVYSTIDKRQFRQQALVERTRMFDQLGVPFPPLILAEGDGDDSRWQLIIEGVPVAEGNVPLNLHRVADDPELPSVMGVQPETHTAHAALGDQLWVPSKFVSELQRAGIATESPEEVLARIASTELPRHASEFLGVHETSAILSSTELRYDNLVKEAQKAMPLQKITLVLRRLVEEQVPVRNVRIVLETIAEWATREKDPDQLAEYVRVALARQISHRYADQDRFIPAYVVNNDVEEMIRGAIKHSSVGSFLALEAEQSQQLLERLTGVMGDLAKHHSAPVVLATMDIRRFLRRFLSDSGIECPVLSHKEVALNYKVQPLAMVSL